MQQAIGSKNVASLVERFNGSLINALLADSFSIETYSAKPPFDGLCLFSHNSNKPLWQ